MSTASDVVLVTVSPVNTGAAPAGPAGGALTGTYPNPGVNVGAGGGLVTGLLPLANVTPSGTNGWFLKTVAGVAAWAAITGADVSGGVPMAGDVTGTTAANTVAQISGTSSRVPVPNSSLSFGAAPWPIAGYLQFPNGATNWLAARNTANTADMVALAVDTGAALSLTLGTTAAFNTVTINSFVTSIVNSTGTVELQVGGAAKWRVNGTALVNVADLPINFGVGTLPGAGSLRFPSADRVVLGAKNSAAADVSLVSWSAANTLCIGADATLTGSQASQITYSVSAGANHFWIVGAATRFQLANDGSTTTLNSFDSSQALTLKMADLSTTSGTGHTLTVQAQNETGTTSVGGKLALTSGSGTTAHGNLVLQTGSVDMLTLNGVGSGSISATFNSTTTGVTFGIAGAAAGATGTLTITGQSAGGTNHTGGDLVLKSGQIAAGAGAVDGSLQLSMGANVMLEIAEEAAGGGQRVLALLNMTSIGKGGSTQMPANTGDGVIYLANRQTAPTANSVGGGILYAEAGALKWRGTAGTTTTIAPA